MHARALLLAIPVALLGCKSGDRAPAAGAAPRAPTAPGAVAPEVTRELELVFTTGSLGYVEPCGCTSKPLGGLPRLAAVLARPGPPRALIDAGNLLFPSEPLDEISGPQHRLKAKLLARAYRSLGAVAINLGPSELAAGREFLAELQREGSVPLVSANVRPIGDAGPAVAQSSLRTIGGVKVGLTGVSTPEALAGQVGVAAIEHAPALQSEVKLLQKAGAELIVVLASVDAGSAAALSRAVPGIDVIVRSPGSPITREPSGPERIGGVVILEAGSQGQHLGRLRVRLGAERAPGPLPFDDGGYSARQRAELTERKIAALQRQIDAWAGDASKAEAIEARRAQIETLRARKGAEAAGDGGGPGLSFALVSLEESVPPDPTMKQVLEAYYAQLKALNASRGDPAKCARTSPEAPSYVGTQACVECHEEAWAFWQKTKHAKAWKTLEDDDKHFDLTCIGCHTVGYEQPGGFCRLSDVGVLKDVGCEMCHGPGSRHVEEEGDTDLIRLTTTSTTCSGYCHVPEHSDTFDYGKYILEITGEGHSLSAGSEKNLR
jgi:hypothetical protein